ncbi:MAG: T9SS type A sorting domain-containing protein, partial [Bacteroidota bacterium]
QVLLTVNAPGPVSWIRSEQTLIQTQGSSLLVTEQGSYTASVSVEGCSSTSAAYEAIITGLGENRKNHMQVYPNPATNRVQLELPGEVPAEWTVSIYSGTGKRVGGSTFTGNTGVLDLQGISAGAYIIRANVRGKSYSTTLIKQ